jgi:hypothetical protein
MMCTYECKSCWYGVRIWASIFLIFV